MANPQGWHDNGAGCWVRQTAVGSASVWKNPMPGFGYPWQVSSYKIWQKMAGPGLRIGYAPTLSAAKSAANAVLNAL